ncbi:MAG TPA: tetratricopeptide repeat protein, partial [Chitinophagaceae bacterium]
MSDKRKEHTETPDAINRLDAFWKQNQKVITSVAIGIIVVIGGWYAYQEYVVKPKEEKAREAIFVAEEYFRADSLQKALNGDSVNKGFVYVIKNYGGTATGNLARYYAGVSYLRLEDYDNAIKYLEDFDTDSKLIQANAWGRLADAYSMKGNKDKAVDLYKKAARHFPEEEANSSEFLFRAAQLLETENKNKEALELYRELKEKFPKSEKGGQADRYIYRIEV